jgi:glycosyltransferase involved in cell wall biosynthesis
LEYWERKIILNVGSEESRRNIITQLKAIKQCEDIVYIKVGNPIINENRILHEHYVAEHNLPVFFIPAIEDISLLQKVYTIADVFISTSLFEWFWRTPIEAQLQGCPVISTHAGWLKEVLGDSCIVLEDPYDVETLAEKIKWVFSGNIHVEALIERGYQNVERFQLSHITLQWEEVFKKILQK